MSKTKEEQGWGSKALLENVQKKAVFFRMTSPWKWSHFPPFIFGTLLYGARRSKTVKQDRDVQWENKEKQKCYEKQEKHE